MNTKALLILSTVQTEAQAKTLSKKILDAKLAACVSVVPNLISRYHWKGKMEEESEQLLLIKSTEKKWKALENLIKKEHPYECPEILAFETDKVSAEYHQWLVKNIS